MSEAGYARAKAIFQQALDRAPASRAAFVAAACAGDVALERDVASLLAAHERAGGFLSGQAAVDPVPSVSASTSMCPVCHGTYEASVRFCPRDRSALVAVEDPFIGRLLDGIYDVERKLGEGGMGAVYLARHHLTERPVAIKVLPKEYTTSPERVKRFLIEGKAASRFTHPNAIMVHDLRSSSDGVLFMVLEYVDGPSLREVLKAGKRFTPAQAVAILEQVASVLDAAHASGVVHRDIKPDNVMIGRDGKGGFTAKVGDLGIARLKEAETDLTRGLPIGTPPYMSPEQWGVPARDGLKGVDGRADVYSLAVMTYEMVTGQRPFPGPETSDYQQQHVSTVAPPAHTREAAVPVAFSDVIARAMAKDRADRQLSAGQYVMALKAALGGAAPAEAVAREVVQTVSMFDAPHSRSPGVRTPTTVERKKDARPDVIARAPSGTVVEDLPATPAKRSKAPLALVALAIVAVAAVVLYFMLKGTTSEPPAPVAVRVEAFRYAIVRQSEDGSWGQPEAGDRPIPIGQPFKFRVTAPESGYLYLVTTNGPGITPMTFLTNKPVAASGVTSNRVDAGAEYEFPGGERGLRLTKEELHSPYTFVYSKTPLTVPAFLELEAGRKLTVVEQAQFDDFVKANKQRSAAENGGAAPVVVTVPKESTGSGPVVWQFTITADVVR